MKRRIPPDLWLTFMSTERIPLPREPTNAPVREAPPSKKRQKPPTDFVIGRSLSPASEWRPTKNLGLVGIPFAS